MADDFGGIPVQATDTLGGVPVGSDEFGGVPVQVTPTPPREGAFSRFVSGAGEGSGISHLWDGLKHISGYDQIQQARDQWSKGNHGQAVMTLLDMASKGPAGRVAEGLVNTVEDQASKAKQAVKEGRYQDAVVHAGAATVPFLAPSADAVDVMKSGDWAGALGRVAGNVGSLVAPAAVEAALPARAAIGAAPVAATELTPEGAFAAAHDIPVPRSVQTGGKFTSALESHLANAPGSSGVMARAAEATRAGLAKTGAELADQVGPYATPESAGESLQQSAAEREAALAEAKQVQDAMLAQKGQQVAESVSPTPATPESAGTQAAKTLEATSKAQGRAAGEAYSRLAEIENDPENLKTVQIGSNTNPELEGLAKDQTGGNFADLSPEDQTKVLALAKKLNVDTEPVPITKDIPLPVDMRPVKASLQSVYDELKRTMPIAQQQASRGLKAIENIIHGDDYVSASTADTNLGAVKAIEREAPNDKTSFLARKAIDAFSPAVDQAISQATGASDAIDALQQGRALTRAKYATRDTFEQLPTEPVQIYRTLAAPGDTNINLLRDVKAKAPSTIRALGRAMVQGLMEDTQASGASRAAAAWDKIGDATKLELLGRDGVSAVDKYFETAKSLEASPVPAGMEAPAGSVPGEPVTAYSRLVRDKDIAIQALREAASVAPEAIPQIARAKLQEIIDMATAPPGQGPGAATAFSKWNKIGDATKQILIPDPALRQQLDSFFNTAKKTAEAIDRNTSRTAYVANAAHTVRILKDIITGSVSIGTAPVMAGINYALAKALTTPGVAVKFTNALNLAANPVLNAAETAQLTALTSQIMKSGGITQKQIEDVPAAIAAPTQPVASEPVATAEPPTQPVPAVQPPPGILPATWEASGKPAEHQVGDVVNLRGVGRVKIKSVNPDGTFEY